MPEITFIRKSGEKLTIDASIGLSVMEIAQKAGISELEGSCGGSLACATCHVYVHPDWWDKTLPKGNDGISEDEEDMLDMAFGLRKWSRLSCQIMITEDLDGLVIALPGADVDW